MYPEVYLVSGLDISPMEGGGPGTLDSTVKPSGSVKETLMKEGALVSPSEMLTKASLLLLM